jgi:hypothetical protein
VDAREAAPIGQVFANPSWFLRPDESWIFVAAYRSMRIAAADLPRPVVRDLGRLVRCAFFHGTMTYLDGAAARLTPVTADNWRVDVSGVVERQTEVGPLTVIATPSRIDGADVVEQTYRERTQTAVGLLLAWEGRNIAHGPLFEMNVAVTSNQVSAVSPTLDNPLTFPAPNLSSARLTALEGAARAVETLGSDVRARVELSLRWYEPGMYSSGIDSFLRLWIAIETLCMPSTTDIRPLIELLAHAYSLTERDVRTRYQIGRVFGLRGLIVHKGSRSPVHSHLLDYLAAIYADALAETLGVPSARMVDRVMAQPGFALGSLLP